LAADSIWVGLNHT